MPDNTKIRAVCHVDFSGPLTHTTCGDPCDPNYSSTTLFISSTTCPRCRDRLQARIEALKPEAEVFPRAPSPALT